VDRRRFLSGAAAVASATALGTGATTGTASAATGETGAPVVVTPSDGRYADLVFGDNKRFTGKPQEVRVVRSTADAVLAVQQAVRSGKRLSVRGGGHCFEDFVYNPDVQVVVDMTEMKRVYFDEERNALVVEGGALLSDAYETLYKLYGVFLPAGVCNTVGIGGHACGGGYGMHCRQHGLSIDHLYGVEVVTVDAGGTARAVVATREAGDPNRDLWWAHAGGGGGNFGVITRYFFRSPGVIGSDPRSLLPAPPSEVLVSAVSWSWDDLSRADFTALAKNFGAWHVDNVRPGTANDSVNAVLFFGHRANGAVTMLTQSDGTDPNAEKVHEGFLAAVSAGVGAQRGTAARPFGEHGPMPEFATPRRLPWLQATRRLGTTVTPVEGLTAPGWRHDNRAAYFRANLTDHHVDTMYEHLVDSTIDASTPASAQLHSYGGRVNAVAPDATAFSHRDSAFLLAHAVSWTDEKQDAKYVGWLRAFYGAMFADTGGVPVSNSVTDGCYVNYPDIDLSDPSINTSGVPWYTLYYKNNYPRLQQVKARWDPRNVFRHSQSIRLP
jgi:FAD/FMN-containing dehydrogenase